MLDGSGASECLEFLNENVEYPGVFVEVLTRLEYRDVL